MSASFLEAAATRALDAASAAAAAVARLREEGELRGTALTVLHIAAGACDDHRDLELQGNRLTSLPPELFSSRSKEVRGLTASRNRLKTLPDEIGRVRCKKLWLAHNEFASPPPLPAALQVLDLSHNALHGELSLGGGPHLSELRSLKLASNRLRGLRLQLPLLSSLDASTNQLEELRAEHLGGAGAGAAGGGLARLLVSHNRLPALHQSLVGAQVSEHP